MSNVKLWLRIMTAIALLAVVVAPRGIAVRIANRTAQPFDARVEVDGDAAICSGILPGDTGEVVVCPSDESSVRVVVDLGQQTLEHDFEVYVEDRAVGHGSVSVVSSPHAPDATPRFEGARYVRRSLLWGVLPQARLTRAGLFALAIYLLASAFRRRRPPTAASPSDR